MFIWCNGMPRQGRLMRGTLLLCHWFVGFSGYIYKIGHLIIAFVIVMYFENKIICVFNFVNF